jgi:uncharacterized protein (DUF433 family)
LDTENAYVERRDNRYYVRNSRIPVGVLAYLWQNGVTAESIPDHYATLDLPTIFGALAFYLEHRASIDQEEAEDAADFQAARAAHRLAHPALYAKLDRILMSHNQGQTTAS